MKTKTPKYSTLLGHVSSITDIGFANGTADIASCSYDGMVRLWKCNDQKNQPIVLNDHDGWVYGVKLIGRTIISAGADKTIRVRGIDQQDLVAAISSRVKRNLTENEWYKYIGSDIEYEGISVQTKQ